MATKNEPKLTPFQKEQIATAKEISEYNELSEEQVRIVEALVNTLG